MGEQSEVIRDWLKQERAAGMPQDLASIVVHLTMERDAALRALAKYQPSGSPPPGGVAQYAEWILDTLAAQRNEARQQAASWEQHIPKFMIAVRDETAKAARQKAKQNRADGKVEQSLVMDTIADIMESLSADKLVANLEKQPCS